MSTRENIHLLARASSYLESFTVFSWRICRRCLTLYAVYLYFDKTALNFAIHHVKIDTLAACDLTSSCRCFVLIEMTKMHYQLKRLPVTYEKANSSTTLKKTV